MSCAATGASGHTSSCSTGTTGGACALLSIFAAPALIPGNTGGSSKPLTPERQEEAREPEEAQEKGHQEKKAHRKGKRTEYKPKQSNRSAELSLESFVGLPDG
jgi:hypothetical protein